MKSRLARKSALLAAVLSGALWMAVPAQAEKPSWAGGGGGHGESHGKGGKGRGGHDEDGARHESRERRGDDGGGSVSWRFDERRRVEIREYYSREVGSGRCPPGLAKKGNGCMPPGQARKWAVGRALPRDVQVYDVPRDLVLRIGLPPEGHKLVRVAGDILMIAVGTGMVVDAIQDLGGM